MYNVYQNYSPDIVMSGRQSEHSLGGLSWGQGNLTRTVRNAIPAMLGARELQVLIVIYDTILAGGMTGLLPGTQSDSECVITFRKLTSCL